jgi:oligoendopeptidase F
LTSSRFWPDQQKNKIRSIAKEMGVEKDRALKDMSVEELRAELKRLKDNLCDLEDTHSFAFGKTSVHIGAEKAQSMQTEFEEECREYNEYIAEIEKELKTRSA